MSLSIDCPPSVSTHLRFNDSPEQNRKNAEYFLYHYNPSSGVPKLHHEGLGADGKPVLSVELPPTSNSTAIQLGFTAYRRAIRRQMKKSAPSDEDNKQFHKLYQEALIIRHHLRHALIYIIKKHIEELTSRDNLKPLTTFTWLSMAKETIDEIVIDFEKLVFKVPKA